MEFQALRVIFFFCAIDVAYMVMVLGHFTAVFMQSEEGLLMIKLVHGLRHRNNVILVS